jgi:pyruvate/2-oxoglutarate dehydrogenase complex dihydrolipoamide acyltransferase (E2) component
VNEGKTIAGATSHSQDYRCSRISDFPNPCSDSARACSLSATSSWESTLPAARKITAQRMTSSFQSAPHFYLGVEANAAALVRLRERLVQSVAARFGVKLTYTDFFLKALAVALTEQPNVNQFWSDGNIVRNESVDIGFAHRPLAGSWLR